jgi:hypothetical protein
LNVSPDLVMGLTRALGAPVDLTAEGVVRTAIERLRGEREYHIECLEDGRWQFHSFYESYPDAQLSRARLRRDFKREFRIIELLRRVMP